MCAYLDSLSANLLDDGLKIILDLQDVSLEAQSTFVSLATHHLSRKHTQILYLKSSYYSYLVPKTGKTIVDLFFCSLPGLGVEVSLVGGCVLTLRDIKDDRQSNVSVSHCE